MEETGIRDILKEVISFALLLRLFKSIRQISPNCAYWDDDNEQQNIVVVNKTL